MEYLLWQIFTNIQILHYFYSAKLINNIVQKRIKSYLIYVKIYFYMADHVQSKSNKFSYLGAGFSITLGC